MNLLDLKQFGLPNKTRIEQINPKSIAIVIDRKSRIIMADGRKIAESRFDTRGRSTCNRQPKKQVSRHAARRL